MVERSTVLVTVDLDSNSDLMQDQRGERVADPDGICMQRPKEHCRKNCLRSIETGSGASQPPPREASIRDAMRLSRRMER